MKIRKSGVRLGARARKLTALICWLWLVSAVSASAQTTLAVPAEPANPGAGVPVRSRGSPVSFMCSPVARCDQECPTAALRWRLDLTM